MVVQVASGCIPTSTNPTWLHAASEDGPYNTLADWVRPRNLVRQGRHGGRYRALPPGGLRLRGPWVTGGL